VVPNVGGRVEAGQATRADESNAVPMKAKPTVERSRTGSSV
jgi:hypothetical protein